MNERIKELSAVARHWAHFDGLTHNPNSSPDILFEQKFAELIVRECADIAKHNVMNISTYSDAEFVSDLIHQNFGVK